MSLHLPHCHPHSQAPVTDHSQTQLHLHYTSEESLIYICTPLRNLFVILSATKKLDIFYSQLQISYCNVNYLLYPSTFNNDICSLFLCFSKYLPKLSKSVNADTWLTQVSQEWTRLVAWLFNQKLKRKASCRREKTRLQTVTLLCLSLALSKSDLGHPDPD